MNNNDYTIFTNRNRAIVKDFFSDHSFEEIATKHNVDTKRAALILIEVFALMNTFISDFEHQKANTKSKIVKNKLYIANKWQEFSQVDFGQFLVTSLKLKPKTLIILSNFNIKTINQLLDLNSSELRLIYMNKVRPIDEIKAKLYRICLLSFTNGNSIRSSISEILSPSEINGLTASSICLDDKRAYFHQLPQRVAHYNDINLHHAESSFMAILESIRASILNKQTILLTNIGKIKVSFKAPRPGRNPKTGEDHIISARYSVRLSKSSKYIDKITGSGLIRMASTQCPHVSISTHDVVYQEILEYIKSTKEHKSRIIIKGLGVFKTTNRKARVVRNPKTGELLQNAEKTVIQFSCAKKLLNELNQSL